MLTINRGSVVGLLALAATVLGQASTTGTATASVTATPTTFVSSASASSSSGPNTFTIDVGKGDHTFKPDTVQANVGDYIKFQFYPVNHSVVRAEYMHPCIPYEMTGKGKVGYFSGFHPVDAILDDPPSSLLLVNDTNPIFFYCSAPGSCITYGMVGVINPNKDVSLVTQRQEAKDSQFMLNPGDPWPLEASSSLASLAGATATSTSAASTATAPAASTTAAAAAAGGSHGLSTGAIAGIAVGSAAVVALAAALFFYIGRAKTLKQQLNRNSATVATTPAMGGPPDMFQAGGTVYMPVHNRHMSQGPYTDMPPLYPKGIDPHLDDLGSLRSASPRTDYGGGPGYYGNMDRHSRPDLSPPLSARDSTRRSHGPHEMYAPIDEHVHK